MENIEYIEEKISFKDLANRIGIDDLDTPEIYDIENEGYEILSFDHENNKKTWSKIKSYVVKQNSQDHYQVNTLHGTKDHKIFVDGKYVSLKDYTGAEYVSSPIQVVDCEVEDTHNYLAEGQINHNTTTPGGMAIPYASSVRVRISSSGQQQIKDKDDNVIGIKVKAKTIKNRVARPFRVCEFQIIFGVGVIEHEEVFDLFRKHCDTYNKNNGEDGIPLGKERINISGAGGWKTFTVSSSETGEVLIDKKFHKAKFNEILYNEEYSKYMDALFESSLVISQKAEDISHETMAGIDTDSIEEINAVKGSRKGK